MKVIGIVGYKKSGKTSLALSIAGLLRDRGYNAGVIKHSNDSINHGKTDTGQFMKKVSQVALITPKNSEIIFNGVYSLKEIISYFSTDFLIIEGFKGAKYFPKILCLRSEDERKELDDGLFLFTAGIDISLKEKNIVNFLISKRKDLEKMVEQVIEKAFLLPDMNCGKCGYTNCYGLARAIVKGVATQEKCVYLKNFVTIKFNGKNIYLNDFMSKLYQNMIFGMLSPLKDIDSLANAHVEIKLKSSNTYR